MNNLQLHIANVSPSRVRLRCVVADALYTRMSCRTENKCKAASSNESCQCASATLSSSRNGSRKMDMKTLSAEEKGCGKRNEEMTKGKRLIGGR